MPQDSESETGMPVFMPHHASAQQRESLAVSLRSWRKAAGLSGVDLAARAGMSQAKISNLERGKTLPTADDAERLASALTLSDNDALAFREQVTILNTRTQSFRSLTRSGYEWLQTNVRDRQARASTIALYADTVVPGLLQTAEYARAVFERIPGFGADSIAAATAARVERQSAVVDLRRNFQFVITEGALRQRLLSSDGMRAQFLRIRSIATMPNVQISVLPWSATPEVIPPTQSFQIYDDEMVVIETLSAEMTLRDPDDVRLYRDAFDALRKTSTQHVELSQVFDRIETDYRAMTEGNALAN